MYLNQWCPGAIRLCDGLGDASLEIEDIFMTYQPRASTRLRHLRYIMPSFVRELAVDWKTGWFRWHSA